MKSNECTHRDSAHTRSAATETHPLTFSEYFVRYFSCYMLSSSLAVVALSSSKLHSHSLWRGRYMLRVCVCPRSIPLLRPSRIAIAPRFVRVKERAREKHQIDSDDANNATEMQRECTRCLVCSTSFDRLNKNYCFDAEPLSRRAAEPQS